MRRLLLAATTLLLGAAVALPATGADRGDPLVEFQWGLQQIRALDAHRLTTGRGVTVAVVDSGVDLDHPDLRVALVPGVDLVEKDTPPDDLNGHGTHVAGIIGSRRGNGHGTVGVAPDARLMPMRVLDEDGGGSVLDAAKAIRLAVDRGARVVNLSIGQTPAHGPLYDLGLLADVPAAIDYAWQKGAVVVFAAGNDSVPLCTGPSSRQRVVCVGSVGPDGRRSWFSNGDALQSAWYLCAPGGAGLLSEKDDVVAPLPPGSRYDRDGDGYGYLAGTSMAAPHVAGVAALLLSRGLTNAQAVDRMLKTARDVDLPGRDSVCGHGIVDAAAAVGAK
jgi:subtilisin family serine protease